MLPSDVLGLDPVSLRVCIEAASAGLAEEGRHIDRLQGKGADVVIAVTAGG